MIFFAVAIAIVLVAASFYADFKWQRWMAARKREHRRGHRP